MCLTLLPTVTLPAQAASNDGKYISELCVATADSASEASKLLTDAGYTDLYEYTNKSAFWDLNEGAGGAFIRLGFKTANDPMEAICAIYLNTSRDDTITASLPQNTGETISLDRIAYKCTEQYQYADNVKNVGDLNAGTTKHERKLYLYTCKNKNRSDAGKGNPLTISPSDLKYYSTSKEKNAGKNPQRKSKLNKTHGLPSHEGSPFAM